ncbi:MAG TPA: ATP-binding protein, partial [Segetibacter sp.]
FFDLQYMKAAIVARQAQQMAEKLDYAKGNGMYWRTLSCTYMDTYYDEKARLFYKDLQVPEPASTVKDKEGEVSYFKQGVIRLQNDLAFFEKEKDQEMIANACFALSTVNRYLHNPADTISTYVDKAIAASKGMDITDAACFLLIQKLNVLPEKANAEPVRMIENEIDKTIRSIKDRRMSAFLSYEVSKMYTAAGKNANAIEKALQANNELDVNEDKQLQVLVLQDLAVNFGYMSMSDRAVEYYKRSVELRDELLYYDGAIRIYFNLAFELVVQREFEEAAIFFSKAKKLAENSKDPFEIPNAQFRYLDGHGQILMGKNKYKDAFIMFTQANDFFKKYALHTNFYIDFYLATCSQKLGNLKKSIRYGEESYAAAASTNYTDKRLLIKICLLLSEVYEQSGEMAKSYSYLKKYRALIKEKEEQDIGNRAAGLEIQGIIEKSQRIKDQLEKEKLQKEKENQNQRWWLISIAGALFSTFVVLLTLFRNNKQKQKANLLLQEQKKKIENTLSELKSAQAQLIQSEKMASLGELTAGIAHEIQNPLNFVNNFSEVNTELLEELAQEVENGNLEDIGLLARDIKENEQKINHHGKRADAIVKGMLLHSRSNSSKTEPTNINALVDEYLRLSYHGLKARDKSFSSDFKTNFSDSIGKINVVPQDIGRVLLNIYNNAFYAVNEKKTQLNSAFSPMVSVSTKKVNDKIEITISDNGNGIPHNITNKIFQPFFTTKPAGQGTGLGLSLSHDIIKAHGGELKVQSIEGQETVFIIQLPV